MKNLMIGILIGMLIGIASVALDNLMLEWAAADEPPKSEYYLEESEEKIQVWETRLSEVGEAPYPPHLAPSNHPLCTYN